MLPVMVYIHGGNFVHMSATSPIFKGDYFANKGQVVLVTFDYRLGKYLPIIVREYSMIFLQDRSNGFQVNK